LRIQDRLVVIVVGQQQDQLVLHHHLVKQAMMLPQIRKQSTRKISYAFFFLHAAFSQGTMMF
jgi:uncharacterized membrane protein